MLERYIVKLNNYLEIIKGIRYHSKKIGMIRQFFYKRLSLKYHFDEWHTTPINFRPYAIGIVRYLNNQKKSTVIEIGCGLGDIIGNIDDCQKEGWDIDKNVIRVGKKLYHKVKFEVGSFYSIKGKNIDYLISVNFIHNISPKELKKNYKVICCNNNINHIVLDVVHDNGYKFQHDISFLFDELGYKVVKINRYPTLNGRRWVYILKKEFNCDKRF